MGEVTRNDCDVFHTFKNIKRVAIVIDVFEGDASESFKRVLFEARDMCPRAIERAIRLAKRAVTPPPKKGASNGDEETEPGAGIPAA